MPTSLCLFAVLLAQSVGPPELELGPAPPPGEPSEMLELLDDLSLEELLNIKIKTGSLLSYDAHDAPHSITVIRGEDLGLSGARTLSEALDIFVPGFQLMSNRWTGDVWGMRGVATAHNTKVLFLVNGVKLNQESRDGSYAETELGFFKDIERIEILRGPAGLVYGSGAIAGVVNVITREPVTSTAEGRFTLGSWRGYSADAFAAAPVGKSGVARLAVGYTEARGELAFASRIYGTQAATKSFSVDNSPKADGTPTAGHLGEDLGSLRLALDYQAERFRLYVRATRRQTPSGSYFDADPWLAARNIAVAQHTPTYIDGEVVYPNDPRAMVNTSDHAYRLHAVDNVLVDARYDLDFGPDKLEAELAFIGASNDTLRYVPDNEYYGARFFYDRNLISPDLSIPVGKVGERRYLGRLTYHLRRLSDLDLSLGAEYRLDDIGPNLQGQSAFDGLYGLKPRVTYHNIAGFAETQYALAPALTLTGGVRADKHSKTEVVPNPKLAAVYRVHRDHTLKLIYQSSSNNGSAETYEPYLLPNGDVRDGYAWLELVPERVHSLELATVHKLSSGLQIFSSMSLNRVSDLFIWSPGLFRSVNAATYNALTAELEVFYKLDALSLGASHAFTRPVATSRDPVTLAIGGGRELPINSITDEITADGQNFINLATHTTKLQATYRLFGGRLRLHTNARVFFGLMGRSEVVRAQEARGMNMLEVASAPIIKWNAGAAFDLGRHLRLGAHGINLLGDKRNRHAVRWQLSSKPAETALYTRDVRQVLLSLEGRY